MAQYSIQLVDAIFNAALAKAQAPRNGGGFKILSNALSRYNLELPISSKYLNDNLHRNLLNSEKSSENIIKINTDYLDSIAGYVFNNKKTTDLEKRISDYQTYFIQKSWLGKEVEIDLIFNASIEQDVKQLAKGSLYINQKDPFKLLLIKEQSEMEERLKQQTADQKCTLVLLEKGDLSLNVETIRDCSKKLVPYLIHEENEIVDNQILNGLDDLRLFTQYLFSNQNAKKKESTESGKKGKYTIENVSGNQIEIGDKEYKSKRDINFYS